MVSYGWTIDYINENVTVPQIAILLETIRKYPPVSILGFGIGEKNKENKLMQQLNSLGDKVKTEKWLDKSSIKSIIRLKDKAKIK